MSTAEQLAQARSALTMIRSSPYNAEAPPQALVADVTPTELHYVRSNFAVPEHDGVLEIGGAVGSPIRLTLADLRAMPAVERVVTLECAGNGRLDVRPLPVGEPWGDNAVSTARWTGVLLYKVLALAHPDPDGVEVLFKGADSGAYQLASVLAESHQSDLNFERSLPLDLVTDPTAEALIAYEMNGEPLLADHGAPFRIVVPRWYGVASVKWLKQIEVLTKPFQGEFQTGHYVYEWPDRPHEPVTLMRPRARLTDPAPSSTIESGTYTIRGKAWSGTGPITNVDLSFTSGSEWQAAVLDPPEGPHQWQTWTFEWEAPVGRHTVRARATDAAGNVQPEIPVWNRLGYGNNAIEVPYVDVQ